MDVCRSFRSLSPYKSKAYQKCGHVYVFSGRYYWQIFDRNPDGRIWRVFHLNVRIWRDFNLKNKINNLYEFFCEFWDSRSLQKLFRNHLSDMEMVFHLKKRKHLRFFKIFHLFVLMVFYQEIRVKFSVMRYINPKLSEKWS